MIILHVSQEKNHRTGRTEQRVYSGTNLNTGRGVVLDGETLETYKRGGASLHPDSGEWVLSA